MEIKVTTGKPIVLGHEGENGVTRVVWPGLLSEWEQQYGKGTVQLAVLRPRDTLPYPAICTVEDGSIVWTVSASDTARDGLGACELTYLVGDCILKSQTWATITRKSLTGNGTDSPSDEPSKAWFTMIQSMIGNLQNLDTIAKDNLVTAINEVFNSNAATGDWTQNDTTAKDYIKNRPGAYSIPSDTAKTKLDMAVPFTKTEEDRPFYLGIFPTIFEIVEGSKYLVAIDGGEPVEYQAVMDSNYGTSAIIKSITGEVGWVIMRPNEDDLQTVVIASKEYKDKRFVLYRKETEEAVKIPAKYLDGAEATIVNVTYGPGTTEDKAVYVADMTSKEIAEVWNGGKNRVVLQCRITGTQEIDISGKYELVDTDIGQDDAYFSLTRSYYAHSYNTWRDIALFATVNSQGRVSFRQALLAPVPEEDSDSGKVLITGGHQSIDWSDTATVLTEAQTLTAAQQALARSNISAIDASLGVAKASVGQTVKVSAVDSSGRPTAWVAADFPSGGGGENGSSFPKYELLVDHTVQDSEVDAVSLVWVGGTDGIPDFAPYNAFYFSIFADEKFGFNKWTAVWITTSVGRARVASVSGSSAQQKSMAASWHRLIGKWAGSYMYNPSGVGEIPLLVSPEMGSNEYLSHGNDIQKIDFGSYGASFGLVSGMHIQIYGAK